MNVLITIQTEKSKEVKGLDILTSRHLKTRTDLEFRCGDDKAPPEDLMSLVDSDVEALGLGGKTLGIITVTVEGAQAWGRMANRSAAALSKIGIVVDGMLSWDAESGQVEMQMRNGVGRDVAGVIEVFVRLAQRAKGSMSHTQHPLTLYDLKQSIGVVHGVSQGDATCEALRDWMNLHEMAVLEEVKEAKAKAKAAAKAEAKKDKPKAKPKAKGKAPAKAPEKNVASLANLT